MQVVTIPTSKNKIKKNPVTNLSKLMRVCAMYSTTTSPHVDTNFVLLFALTIFFNVFETLNETHGRNSIC